MSMAKSSIGGLLATAYLLVATFVTIEDLRSGGGFFNLRGLATYFVTFPVSFLFFRILSILGVDNTRFRIPLRYSLTTVVMISVFIALCAAIVYLIGAAIELGIRRIILARR